jgi:uncharacterized membrane protein YqhA
VPEDPEPVPGQTTVSSLAEPQKSSLTEPQKSSLTEKQKKVVAVALVIHLLVVVVTWRDLRRRPDAAVRGKKRFWRFAAGVNTIGSVAYWLFGRRRWPEPSAG